VLGLGFITFKTRWIKKKEIDKDMMKQEETEVVTHKNDKMKSGGYFV
jgi:hypothetical protein